MDIKLLLSVRFCLLPDIVSDWLNIAIRHDHRQRQRQECSASVIYRTNFHSAHPTGWAESISGNGVCVDVRHHFEDDHYSCS